MIRGAGTALLVMLVSCAAPRWQGDLQQALSGARRAERDLVVFFALQGRDASDHMASRLDDPTILAALANGDFDAVACDGFARQRLYGEWVGGGEGMGIAVLDGNGVVYAARPGPQDPAELAAFLGMCAGARRELAEARAALDEVHAGPVEKYQLGSLLLKLGCRKRCEPLLLDAALAGVPGARHRVARLYALDGNVIKARRWLENAWPSPQAQVTEGYLLFKERRHKESARVLEAVIGTGKLVEDRQRAILYLGKALHQDRRDRMAVALLEVLSKEGTGSTFEAAALHTLGHIRNPDGGHTH